MTNSGISVIVPVYNEENTLDELCSRTSAALESIGSDYEIVFVDDGSSDSSRTALRCLHEVNPRVKALFLDRNYGQHTALLAGIKHAKKGYIVTIDADLQNDPADIAKIVAELDRGYDAVKGKRLFRETNKVRRVYSFFANMILKGLINKDIDDYGCALGIYKRELFDRIFMTGKMPKYIFYFVFRSGARIAEIPVTDHRRKGSDSRYGFFKLARLFTELVMTFLIYSKKGYQFFKVSLWILYFNILISVAMMGCYVTGVISSGGIMVYIGLITVLGLSQLVSHVMIRKHILEYERIFTDEPLYVVAEQLD